MMQSVCSVEEILRGVPPHSTINIAVVGKAGSGKSTLINAIVSLFSQAHVTVPGQVTLEPHDYHLLRDYWRGDQNLCQDREIILRDCVGFTNTLEMQLLLEGKIDDGEKLDMTKAVQYVQRKRTPEAMIHCVFFVIPATNDNTQNEELHQLRQMFNNVRVNGTKQEDVQVQMIPIITMCDVVPNMREDCLDDLLKGVNGKLREVLWNVNHTLGFPPVDVFTIGYMKDFSATPTDPRAIVLSHALSQAVISGSFTLKYMKELYITGP